MEDTNTVRVAQVNEVRADVFKAANLLADIPEDFKQRAKFFRAMGSYLAELSTACTGIGFLYAEEVKGKSAKT